MADTGSNGETRQPSPHVIIAGFGIPGRFIGELLDFKGGTYSVIELNAEVAERCKNVHIVVGDVRDENILREAGIERASMIAITLPQESIVHEAIQAAKRLKPDIHVIARVNFTSAGLRARTLGADSVVIGEQLIAREFFRLMEGAMSARNIPATTTDAGVGESI
jgi:CPA2 family monovalent cation:H+ antiporter-2